MILQVDPASPVPPYEQIRVQVAAMVDAGVLEPGARLPSIRQLAGDLGLAGGTVARAYRELEADGVVTTRGRHGTVVAERKPAHNRAAADRDARIAHAASDLAAVAQQSGTDLDAALAAVRAAFARLGTPPPGDLR